MNRRPLSLVVCLLVPFAILAAGLGSAGVHAYRSFGELMVESGRGQVPPGFSVDLTEPGKHTLWLHTYTVVGGVEFESAERLPEGARVVVTEESTRNPVVLNSLTTSRKNIGSESAVSVGTFEVASPTRVTVQGTGFPKPVVLSVAPEKLGETFRAILKIVGIVVLTLFLAIVTLIVLLHRRHKMIQAEARMHGG